MYYKTVDCIYSEKPDAANQYRERYLCGIKETVEKKVCEAQTERLAYGAQIILAQTKARHDLTEMLGWPLAQAPETILNINEDIFVNDQRWILSRISFEVFPRLWFYGELLRHKTVSRLPLIIVQHGGAGTPEVCSSFFDSHNYNDMAMRVLQHGVNVFAPQLLLWKNGEFGSDAYSERLVIDNELRRIGGSIAALEIYCIQRAIDYFYDISWCNGKLGMVGLSYGSFYSLFTTACDERINATLACSLFSWDKKQFPTDFSWRNMYRRFGDAEVGALIYPRPLRIEYGDKDQSIWVAEAHKEFDRLKAYYHNRQDELYLNIFDGGHEFCPEDDGIKWLLNKIGI